MTKLTQPAAQRLAEFVRLVSGEWNTPGILAALEQVAPTANAWDIAHALLNIAEDPTVKTPAMLTRPGNHWRRTDGSRIERRGDHNQPCPDHPDHDMPCTACESTRYVPTEEDRMAWRRELAAHTTVPPRQPAPTLTDPDTADRARARIDAERQEKP